MPTQFQSVLDAVTSVLASMVSAYSTPDPIFAEVLKTGSREKQWPFAFVMYGKDSVIQRSVSPDAGAKMTMTVPLYVLVTFNDAIVPDDEEPADVHMTLLGELIAAVHADRTLGGTAQDCMYSGEGLQLIVESIDDETSFFSFAAKFETTIRYAGADPTTE